MDLGRSFFTGSRITRLVPCTNSEGRLCHIFREIFLWNKYFWPVGLELRELSPRSLSLVERNEAYVGAHADQDMPRQMRVVAKLLHHLLTNHHCVTSAAIVTSIFREHHQLICDALSKSLGLQKLKLYAVRTATQSPQNTAPALPHLRHLRELELQNIPFKRTFVEGFSEFLTSTRLLTTLTVTHQYLECEEYAVSFLQGLMRNQTITTLSFDITLLGQNPFCGLFGMRVPPRSAVVFADYLRTNKTLCTLVVRGGYLNHFHVVSRPILEALIINDTLNKLILTSLRLEEVDIELITRLFSHNRILTCFNMIGCDCSGISSRASSKLVAITENKTLQEMTLSLPFIDAMESRSLFSTLASTQSLNKVAVNYFSDFDVAEICRAVQETGARDRFLVGKYYVLEDTVDQLTECKELTSVAVHSSFFSGLEPLLTTLSLLSLCSHVTSLRLEVWSNEFRGRVSSLIAQCIKGMTALRKLELSIVDAEMRDGFNEARRELAQALSVNKSIRKLSVEGPCFGETEIETLADTLHSSRTLCELSFFPSDHRCVISLMRNLSMNISSNYTLLDMQLDKPWRLGVDWFMVSDVIRRNCSLVTRAAHFVMGTRNRHCAAAAELVHSNPGLVEKVQELASVDESEAASRIQKSLESFSELDEFMRLAGVVKHGVTCQSRGDGRKQLADIRRNGWSCIRKYIKMGDIWDEQ
ncbi:hypothetical protein HPB52_011414 [Rhipicephalus sanguineus]|uniref:Nlr family card domain protein n=1 Tax=Rhipicephalus sanguineus TaxID=34632 RepID=A0A9D4PK52_RHISA|nr:hypothetical protein HPB52_011414 [Rhipicephalus sanguineus]